MTQKVLKVGSSVAVTIPKKSLKELGLKAGDEVRVTVDARENEVRIKPLKKGDKEILEWTDNFIKRYHSALVALAKK